MKTILCRLAFSCAFLFLADPTFAQGSLAPSGAPAPTMKTLDQIEPRIDVMKLAGDINTHVLITNAGSYYLSTNLAVTKNYGITIATAGVTLDLNGFEIARVSGSGGDGIRIHDLSHRATVRNGNIRGFSNGINGSLGSSKGCLFEKIAVTGCSLYGIYTGESARVVDCRAHDNSGTGIYARAGSVISGCTAQGNQGTYGIFGDTGTTIRDCSAYNNDATTASSYGIYGAGGNTIIGCSSRSNGNTNSPSTSYQGAGIYTISGSTVKDCSVEFNQGDGIRVYNNCFISGNTAYFNGTGGDGAGIHTTNGRNRIEANTVTSNDRGIHIELTDNLIIRNSAGGNGINYVIEAGNKVGVIVSAPDSGTISGSTGGSGIGSTDPWANISL